MLAPLPNRIDFSKSGFDRRYRYRYMGKKFKAAIVAATAITMTVLTATSASAWEGDFNGNGGGAAGTINYVGIYDGKKTLDIDLTIIDSISDGFCARVKVIFDKPNYPDPYKYSPMACGFQTAKHWDTRIGEYSTRGAKIHMCRVHSDGSDQSCSSELYIDMP